MKNGIRNFVPPVQVFQQLYRRGLTEEDILGKMIKAKKTPEYVEVEGYKFRYNRETKKYEDNLVASLIDRVLEGEEPNDVINNVSKKQGADNEESNGTAQS